VDSTSVSHAPDPAIIVEHLAKLDRPSQRPLIRISETSPALGIGYHCVSLTCKLV